MSRLGVSAAAPRLGKTLGTRLSLCFEAVVEEAESLTETLASCTEWWFPMFGS